MQVTFRNLSGLVESRCGTSVFFAKQSKSTPRPIPRGAQKWQSRYIRGRSQVQTNRHQTESLIPDNENHDEDGAGALHARIQATSCPDGASRLQRRSSCTRSPPSRQDAVQLGQGRAPGKAQGLSCHHSERRADGHPQTTQGADASQNGDQRSEGVCREPQNRGAAIHEIARRITPSRPAAVTSEIACRSR
jgi:hypothetical protein